MKNKLVTVAMLLMLLVSVTPMALRLELAHADPGPTTSLVVSDALNRINATIGIKSGSKLTLKVVIKNVGPPKITWYGFLTSLFFRGGTTVQTADLSFEVSPDCSTWTSVGAGVVADDNSSYDVELAFGAVGGETLAYGATRTYYIRTTFNADLTKVTKKDAYSMALWTFNDTNTNRHWEWDGTNETIYSEPKPFGFNATKYDTPIQITPSIVHTVEVAGNGRFYYNIQDAIDAPETLDGYTLFVYSGTYKEALYITKRLTLNTASTPVINGSQSHTTTYYGAPFTRSATIFVVNTTNVVINGFDVEGTGLGTQDGIMYVQSSGKVTNCIVSPNTIGDMASVGIESRGSTIDITGCTIKNFGRIGAYFAGSTGGVYSSTIIGQKYGLEGQVNYGIEVESHQGVSTIKIIGNTIYNCDNTFVEPTWSSAGILIDGWSEYDEYPESIVNMTCNNIYKNYHGIEICSNGVAFAHYNNIYNNTRYGVFNSPDYANNNVTFDARYNWWGSATGPYHKTNLGGLGNKVSDNVAFVPWLLVVKVPPLTHDIAILSVTANPSTRVKIGGSVTITVVVKNNGNCYENATLTVTYGGIIKTETMKDWTPGTTKTFTYTWDTTGQTKCLHLISALLDAVTGETYLFNNYRDTNIALVTTIPQPTTLKVMPVPATGVVGGPLKANITINGLDAYWGLVGFSFKLNFNKTLLKATGVSLGDWANYFNLTYEVDKTINNANGYVTVGYIWNPAAKVYTPPSGSGTLVTITFLVNIAGTGSFSLTDVKLAALGNEDKWCVPYSQPIDYTTVGGTASTKVPMLGDINKDGVVDIYDIITACMAYDSHPGDLNWNPAADISPEFGIVDIYDVATVLINYGKSDP